MTKRKDGRYVESLTLPNGKRKFFYGSSAAEVKRKILNYKDEKEKGPLFRDVAEEWWKKKAEKLARNSLRNYEPAVERAKQAFGDRYINQITAKDISKYIESFSANRAAKTVATQLNIISQIIDASEVRPNPANEVKIPRGLPRETRILPSDEELAVVDSSIGCVGGLLAYFLYYTGCRRGEALAMQYRDIDRENHLIHVRKSLSAYGGVREIKNTKTYAGKRDIVLLDNLAAVLPEGDPDEYIFTWHDELMSDGDFEWMWKLYCRETGLNISPHRLRHGFATLLHDAEVDILDAARMMGHTTKQMTELYTHISRSRLTSTYDKLNTFVSSRNVVKTAEKPDITGEK